MKKTLILSIVFLSITSCRMDVQNIDQIDYSNMWHSEETVNVGRTGVYATFRSFNEELWQMGVLRSDVFYQGPLLGSSIPNTLTENNIQVVNAPFKDWAGFFKLIHYANDFIDNAPKAVMNQQTLNTYLGEIYGIRAYIYFTMLKTWGEVPLVTEAFMEMPMNNQLNKKRMPKTDVAAQIKADIDKSLELFGSGVGAGTSIYWSKAATLTLKGEAYLWFGSVLGEGAPAFNEAKTALMGVTGHALVSEYKNIWGVSNEKNKEFIFAFDYQIDQSENFYNSILTAKKDDIKNYFDSNGVSLSNFNVRGANRYGVSEKILTKFADEPEDLRALSTLRLVYSDNNNGQGYPIYDENNSNYKGAIWLKFLGEEINGQYRSYADFPLYRYADVLLMLAEAKNHLGEDPGTEINLIRKRAFGTNFPEYSFVSGSKEENAKAILEERLKEFLGEGKRWSDLQRFGANYIFQEVESMNLAPVSGDPKKVFMPISQSMIDEDPLNMTQTDGW